LQQILGMILEIGVMDDGEVFGGMGQGGTNGSGFAFIDRVTEEEPLDLGVSSTLSGKTEAFKGLGRVVARAVIDHDHLNRFQKG